MNSCLNPAVKQSPHVVFTFVCLASLNRGAGVSSLVPILSLLSLNLSLLSIPDAENI